MEIRLCLCNKFNSRQQMILTPSDDNGKNNAKLLQNYSPELVPPLLAEDIRNKNTNILDTNKKESSLLKIALSKILLRRGRRAIGR